MENGQRGWGSSASCSGIADGLQKMFRVSMEGLRIDYYSTVCLATLCRLFYDHQKALWVTILYSIVPSVYKYLELHTHSTKYVVLPCWRCSHRLHAGSASFSIFPFLAAIMRAVPHNPVQSSTQRQHMQLTHSQQAHHNAWRQLSQLAVH